MLPEQFREYFDDMQNGDVEQSMFPAKISLAMSYVPFQYFEQLYDEDTALTKGTLFKALDLPFMGGKKG